MVNDEDNALHVEWVCKAPTHSTWYAWRVLRLKGYSVEELCEAYAQVALEKL